MAEKAATPEVTNTTSNNPATTNDNGFSNPDPKHPSTLLLTRARAAADHERSMTLLQGIRTYPKATCWSLLISLCIAMEAFDLCLLNTFYAMPQFQETFGTLQADGSYELSAAWQTGLSNGTQCGQIIGLIVNGWVSERFGYRYTSVACLGLIAAWVGLLFTATSPQQLLAGNILCGIVCLSISPVGYVICADEEL